MASLVPSLSELLNEKPQARYPLDDSKITTRCPKPDCFSLQRLSEAALTRGMFEARYACIHCGTTMVVVRPQAAPGPGLPISETQGTWTYWMAAAGIHLRLANSRRLQTKPTTPTTPSTPE
jgi:hypothetical protein